MDSLWAECNKVETGGEPQIELLMEREEGDGRREDRTVINHFRTEWQDSLRPDHWPFRGGRWEDGRHVMGQMDRGPEAYDFREGQKWLGREDREELGYWAYQLMLSGKKINQQILKLL